MDRPSRGHPLEQSWTNLFGKDVKRRSWWSRKEPPAPPSVAKQEPPDPDQPALIRSGPVPAEPQQAPNPALDPVRNSQKPHIDALPVSEEAAPPPPLRQRMTTKSEGSVGSNLNKLSIEDRRSLLQQPSSLQTAARTKRAAEPSGQVPEGSTPRLSKRAPPPSTLADDLPRNIVAHVPAPEVAEMGVKAEPGVLDASQSLPRKARRASSSDAAMYTNDDYLEPPGKMLLQPETRPITQDQLVNEVKGIYAGLVMVEKKCVEIDQQQSKTTNKLSDEQWQALIALHRTLLYEHHDFFLASQHPSSSTALRRLATKIAMPARMWRHGIHSFLELLRHRLPDSLEHMLAFVYLAYSMMALLMESVPSFVETWIECLGDLARYRMAIEEVDLRDREVWSGCAKMWYEKAADKSPNVGRIQHHLAVLARPNIVQQLFYYSKALISVTPFQNARESVMLLFSPFLQEGENVSQKYIAVEAAFITFHGVWFTHGLRKPYSANVETFLSGFDAHIARIGAKFRTQGPEIVSSLCAAAFAFGNPDSVLMKAFQLENDRRVAEAASKENEPKDPSVNKFLVDLEHVRHSWTSSDADQGPRAEPSAYTSDGLVTDPKISTIEETSAQAVRVLGETIRIVTQRIGDKNIVPFMHTQLAFLWSLAHFPGALPYVQAHIPFDGLVNFLNTLGRSGVDESHVVGDDFPQQLSGTGRQLPEDFPMRGLIWAPRYYPETFFQGQVVDEDERTLDLPSHAAPRAERCLWLGYQLSRVDYHHKSDRSKTANGKQLNRWISYDEENKQFSVVASILD